SAASRPRTIRPGAIQRKFGESLRSSPTALRLCAFCAATNLLKAPLISSLGAAHTGFIASIATAVRTTRVAARCERITLHLQSRNRATPRSAIRASDVVNCDIHLNKATPMGLRLVHARPERENSANDSNDPAVDRTDEPASLVCDFFVAGRSADRAAARSCARPWRDHVACFFNSLATRTWPYAGCSNANASTACSICGSARFLRFGFLREISSRAVSPPV